MSEHAIGSADTFLADGAMRRVEVEGTPLVIARTDGRYYAFGATCSHYGASLDEGVLRGTTVICPWHHACFDIRNGARLEPPALNDVPHYPLRLDGDQILVTLPHNNELEPMGSFSESDARIFVIVGGGAAGNAAAEELRRSGYRGKLILLNAAPTLPLDRPNLSKDYLTGGAQPEWMPLRGEMAWYAAREIDLRLNTRVVGIDLGTHTVKIEGGDLIRYDKLLLAPGAEPRRLRNIAGESLAGIYTLRTLADSNELIKAVAVGKRVVIIGASFIGLEVASSLANTREAIVTVVAIEETPFDRILGVEIGRMFQREHESNGIEFRLQASVARFIGTAGHVSAVELTSGETLPVDFVVLGVGVAPATDFVAGAGLSLDDKDRSMLVNDQLQSSDQDVYAAGDIAKVDGTRIEHWRLAEQHGIVAAHTMLGQVDSATAHVPFFWTVQWSIIFNYVGHAENWDAIIFRGSPDNNDFLVFYIGDNGKLLAAGGCNYDRDLDAIEFILRDSLPLTPDQMRDPAFDLVAYVGE